MCVSWQVAVLVNVVAGERLAGSGMVKLKNLIPSPTSSSSPPSHLLPPSMPTEPFQLPRYFDTNPNTWDIADYLDLLGNLSYDVAVSRWLRSLEFIANDPGQTRLRQERAQHLHDRYNNTCVSILSFLFLM